MAIAVERTVTRGVNVVSVTGEVDVLTAPALSDELNRVAASDAARVVVDLTGVEFLDSTGLGVLVGTRKDTTATGGAFAIVCTSARIARLFSITGLDGVFDVYADLDAAVSALAG